MTSGLDAEAARALGRAGEDLACGWYLEQGYDIVARNWRCELGEIDVVARRRSTVVICEVKARSTTRFGHPLETVSLAKQRRLRRLAARYLDDEKIVGVSVRFDVAGVLGGEIDVVTSAF